MDNKKLARDLLKIAKSLTSDYWDLDRGDRKDFDRALIRKRYVLVDDLLDDFNRIKGVDSASVSDGFNDESTFTFYIEPEMERFHEETEKNGITKYYRGKRPSVPLKNIRAGIKAVVKAFNRRNHSFESNGIEGTIVSKLDGKIESPRRLYKKTDKSYTSETYQVTYDNVGRIAFDVFFNLK